MPLLIAFITVPILEIALFLQVGGLIGFWPTIAIVILTALLGTWLVRSQGRQALRNLQRSLNELRDPSLPLAEGAMILIAGVLLLTPGFFTDACGFALLVPGIRQAVFRAVRSRIDVQRFEMGTRPRSPAAPDRGAHRFPAGGTTVEGDYTEVDPRPERDTPPQQPHERDKPSGWTQH